VIRLSGLFSAASVLVIILVGCARLEQACIAMPAATSASPPLKSGFSISGDSELSYEDILSSAMPPVPAWAKSSGISNATITLGFTVDSRGSVLPGIAVKQSTGYHDWDQEVKKTVSRWKFKPAPGVETRAGTIAFRFVLR
jgi:TonB family protein